MIRRLADLSQEQRSCFEGDRRTHERRIRINHPPFYPLVRLCLLLGFLLTILLVRIATLYFS